MKHKGMITCLLSMLLVLSACQKQENTKEDENRQTQGTEMTENYFTPDTKIREVMSDPVFGSFGRLIFPVNSRY